MNSIRIVTEKSVIVQYKKSSKSNCQVFDLNSGEARFIIDVYTETKCIHIQVQSSVGNISRGYLLFGVIKFVYDSNEG